MSKRFPIIKSNVVFVLSVACTLLFSSCDKTDESIVDEPNGEFTIAGETYELRVFQKLSFGLLTELRDIRLLFYSKPYPIEGEDVGNLHVIGIDIMIMNNTFTGNYTITGDSSLNSIIYAYCGTDLTVKDQKLVSGNFYEFENGEISVSKNGDKYDIEMELIDDVAGTLIGNYTGSIQ